MKLIDMTHANDVVRVYKDTAPTLQNRMGTGGNQVPLVLYAVDMYNATIHDKAPTIRSIASDVTHTGGY